METLEEIEEQKQMGGFLGELAGLVLAQLLLAPLTIFEFIIDDIYSGIDYNHYSTH